MSRRWQYILIAIGVIIAAGAIWFAWFTTTINSRVRARVVNALEQRFDADIQLKSVDVSLWPEAKVAGTGLVIRHRGWADRAPLIRIGRFMAETDWGALILGHNHVRRVELQGLKIHIPPRGASAFKETFSHGEEVESGEPGHDTTHLQFFIDTIQAEGTKLIIAPKVPGKSPLEFDIKNLTLHSVGPGKALKFVAELTNIKPPGLIDSIGYFGPWQKDDPRATPVSGKYTFKNANLGVFNGISGTLSSKGSYNGVLQHIETKGTTDVPNFALQGGDPVHLRTTFHAIVNGTNGDTLLEPVVAIFLHSKFICRGGVTNQPGRKGKTVSLQAKTQSARMEDILALVVGGKPFLKGAVNFQSRIVIPPGPEDMIDKLRLKGQFQVWSATFSDPKIKKKLIVLSDRARGISKGEQQKKKKLGTQRLILSHIRGRFQMAKGRASFSRLAFTVPGAAFRLHGAYNLKSGRIDMHGIFRMHATVSETQSGIKSWLLKPFNKLFEEGKAGFQAPIEVTGTKDNPVFGIDIFHHEITIQ
ncbi:MAG TPA: AsmA-like C-terminal region-containing protein [Bryobacteraceae bacterium]